jgi:hypothetical protein
MGCDEWHPEPILITEPTAQARGAPGTVLLSGGSVAGEPPSDFAWFREGILVNDGPAYAGAQTGELTVRLSAPTAAGGYQVVVSNAYGVATSSVVSLTLHYVDAAGTSPVPPYASWSSAATNIQEAIDAAALGAVVVVADGEYAHGGRPVLSSPTNRVVLDKAVSLVSMNGAHATIIKGARDPIGSSGIGEAAVRCAWLEAGGILNGFTLTAGATKQVAYSAIAGGGGGVYCRSPDALVFNSILKDNSAYYEGGGARRGTLRNCLLTDNICALYGGGAAGATLWNCTVTANTGGSGGGISGCTAHNSIVFFNSGADQVSSTLTDSCFPGASPSQGNISADPQLVDAFHLGVNSPCRGAGTSVYNTGFDLDGQAWLSPPSMGCDEVYEADFVGPLAVAIEAIDTNVVQGVPLSLTGVIDGLASRLAWGFGDGMVSSNLSFITLHSWTNPGDYTVIFTAFNTDNPAGVSTNVTIQVLPLLQPELSAGSLSNNTFTLNLITQPGVTYQVEQTTNLTPPVVWNLLKNVTGTGDLLPVTDAAATNEMRFYRARVP